MNICRWQAWMLLVIQPSTRKVTINMKNIMMLAAVAVTGIFLMTGCSTCCKKDGACSTAAMKCDGGCCKDAATCAKCCKDEAGCAKCCKK